MWLLDELAIYSAEMIMIPFWQKTAAVMRIASLDGLFQESNYIMWGMPRASIPLCHRQRSNSPRLAGEAHQISGELPSCRCVLDKGCVFTTIVSR